MNTVFPVLSILTILITGICNGAFECDLTNLTNAIHIERYQDKTYLQPPGQPPGLPLH
jgi:hypothetical protein